MENWKNQRHKLAGNVLQLENFRRRANLFDKITTDDEFVEFLTSRI